MILYKINFTLLLNKLILTLILTFEELAVLNLLF